MSLSRSSDSGCTVEPFQQLARQTLSGPRAPRHSQRSRVLSELSYLGVFFFDVFQRERRGDFDRVVEDRRVLAGCRRQAGGRVDDWVEDEFDQEPSAAADAGRRPGVVDQFVAVQLQDQAFFEEFEFARRAFDRGVGRRWGWFCRWSVPTRSASLRSPRSSCCPERGFRDGT